MARRRLTLLLLAVVVTGCQSIEGRYEPGCAAFAGDRVVLDGGRYTWDRFTDARRVDAAGNVIDPYPDFPKTGPYAIDGKVLRLLDRGEETIATFHLHGDGNDILLLTVEEHDAVSGGAAYPDCALTRKAP